MKSKSAQQSASSHGKANQANLCPLPMGRGLEPTCWPASLGEIIKAFFLIGVISFGPSMFALVHQQVVEQKKWLTEKGFREAVTYSELAPGPFTVHVVMYVGYALKGFWGLVLATLFFCLPSVILICVIALSYQNIFQKIPGIEYFMTGVWAALLASLVSTVLRIGRDVFRSPVLMLVAVLTLVVVVVTNVSYVIPILAGGVGYVVYKGLKQRLAK